MNNIEIPPFYVGQEVVAASDHSDGRFKAGQEFIVTQIWRCPCKCNDWVVTVGLRYDFKRFDGTMVCVKCNCNYSIKNGESAYKAYKFRPKLEISAFISMSEVVKLETVGAN